MNQKLPVLVRNNTRLLLPALILVVGDLAIRGVHAATDAVPPKVITAQEFRLVDKQGVTRGEFTTLDDGSPALVLRDSKGARRAALRVRSDGSSIMTLNSADETPVAQMDTGADGRSSISVSDREGKSGAAFVIVPKGEPTAMIRSRESKIIWIAPEPDVDIKADAAPDGKPGEKSVPPSDPKK